MYMYMYMYIYVYVYIHTHTHASIRWRRPWTAFQHFFLPIAVRGMCACIHTLRTQMCACMHTLHTQKRACIHTLRTQMCACIHRLRTLKCMRKIILYAHMHACMHAYIYICANQMQSGTEREMHAVDSEHNKNIQDDDRREYTVLRYVCMYVCMYVCVYVYMYVCT